MPRLPKPRGILPILPRHNQSGTCRVSARGNPDLLERKEQSQTQEDRHPSDMGRGEKLSGSRQTVRRVGADDQPPKKGRTGEVIPLGRVSELDTIPKQETGRRGFPCHPVLFSSYVLAVPSVPEINQLFRRISRRRAAVLLDIDQIAVHLVIKV